MQQDTKNANSCIGLSELCSRVIEIEVVTIRIERVCTNQTQQQQRWRQIELKWFHKLGANIILERAVFHYDQKIDYCADTSVTIGEMPIIWQYCKALKYSGESTELCCAGGKVRFPQ